MLRLTVIAHPNARVDRVDLTRDGTLNVWVRQRPVDGRANVAIEQTVASALGLRPRQVRLVVGASSRRKIIDVDLADHEALRQRLALCGLRAD
jgi:uncharacterized protein YggU (UPF0235/DUF167 family)